MRKMVGLALILGMLALSPGCASAAGDTHSQHPDVGTADTPAEHAALAKHYRAEAAEARANAARHQSMGKAYGGNEKLSWAMGGQAHCQKISDASTAMAKEYEALAKLHDEESK